MTVGRVGVRSTVNGAAGGGRDSLVPATGAQEQNGGDDGDHQNEAGHGYSDGEISRRYAQLVVPLLYDNINKNHLSNEYAKWTILTGHDCR